MPMYEFECPECGERFEALSAVGTERETCRACGHEGCERVMSQINPIHRQLTANQRRRLEDKRGVNRDGARTRWKESMAKRRERKKPGA